jgi:hypothetical protein
MTTTSAVSATIPAPMVSMNSAATGAPADLASIADELDRGARATIPVTAISPVKARAARAAPTDLFDVWTLGMASFRSDIPGREVDRSHQPFSQAHLAASFIAGPEHIAGAS